MKLKSLLARTGASQPVEVGVVKWLRNLDEATTLSEQTGKPIFALFQEVPGCSGCKQFGKDVLSHPVVVDAIEDAFIPLLIHNNSSGYDAEILRAFDEPAWNYQVVRFLDAEGADIIPREERVWETGPLTARMTRTLEVSGRDVPAYFRLLEQSHADRLAVAHFAQRCFWVGEFELGKVDGVVATQAAFMGGREVTSVWFDPEQVSLLEVASYGYSRDVADVVFTNDAGLRMLDGSNVAAAIIDDDSHRVAPKSDQKRQLKGVAGLSKLSISQLTKANSYLRSDFDRALDYLAPSQRAQLTRP